MDLDNVSSPSPLDLQSRENPPTPKPNHLKNPKPNLPPKKGCLEPLTPLLTYPTFTTDGGRGALSNNILGAEPNHPFWKLLTDSLIPYDYNYFFPYITISYASGQWFETAAWEAYHWGLKREGERKGGELVRIMMDDRPGTEPWVFFSQERGGSWVNVSISLFTSFFFFWILERDFVRMLSSDDYFYGLTFRWLGRIYVDWLLYSGTISCFCGLVIIWCC